MRPSAGIRRRLKGFTLIELLVVVAVIALLVSILLPSLRGARKEAQAVACMSNLDQVMKAVLMYQNDYNGWLPISHMKSSPWGSDDMGSLWSEAAWYLHKNELWFYKLTPTYLADPKALICPGDPILTRFDFESKTPGGQLYSDATRPACGYGMTYVLRHFAAKSRLMLTSHFPPKMPSNTILMAEVGPDDDLRLAPLYGCVDGGDAGFPWRDGGRLLWDDGIRGWYNGPTWLTGRHLGKINMSTFGGAVKRVSTVEQMRDGPKRKNPACWGMDVGTRTAVCPLCTWNEPHYQFYKVALWWWTGAVPNTN
jgi:prepilin-type N-terminal cleavage/methylation domain-containing protein